jgi:hypothetical protein
VKKAVKLVEVPKVICYSTGFAILPILGAVIGLWQL